MRTRAIDRFAVARDTIADLPEQTRRRGGNWTVGSCANVEEKISAVMGARHEIEHNLARRFPIRVAVIVAPAFVRCHATFPHPAGIADRMSLRRQHVFLQTATT